MQISAFNPKNMLPVRPSHNSTASTGTTKKSFNEQNAGIVVPSQTCSILQRDKLFAKIFSVPKVSSRNTTLFCSF
jgi:hypothetical protein